MALRRTTPGERGYDEYEVDVFLDRVEATLRGADALTARDVHDVRFSEVAGGGYDQYEVEALLDLIEDQLNSVAISRGMADDLPLAERFAYASHGAGTYYR